MTKKDFELIAKIINDTFTWINKGAVSWQVPDKEGMHQHAIVRNLGVEFEKLNPRFDYDKWYKACGVPELCEHGIVEAHCRICNK